MKNYTSDQIRNIVLLGNAGSGKTTLAECMLFEGKIIDRRGEVDKKNTASDYHPIEHENGASVYSSVLFTEYNDKKLNIIDAPGADDFINGAVAALSVSDSVLMVINGQNGVEVGTEIHNRWAEKTNKPMVLAINQLDHEKANFEKVVEALKESFGGAATVVQFPVSVGADFNSIVDVLTMKLYSYKDGKVTIGDIPADQMERAEELRNELIEKAAENDENLMEIFFENDTLTEDEMRKGIKAGLLQRGLFPIFCISSKHNTGVGRLTEFLSNVCPSPMDVKGMMDTEGTEIKCDSAGKPAMFFFKTAFESHIGEVNFFKVLSGEITEGIDLTNLNNSNKERVSQLFASAGKNRIKTGKMTAGDIGATVKLKGTKTNHTLASGLNNPIAAIQFPPPKFRTAIRPASEGEEEKLSEALKKLHEEDQTLLVEHSRELKQIIISGQGEYHVNIMKWHLDHIFKVETELIAPRIPYRETITKVAQAEYRHKKQSGGSGQFGEVHMIIEPFTEGMPDPVSYKVNGKELKMSVRDKEAHKLSWGGQLVFVNCIVGGSIDARFHPAILKGIMEKMEEGPLTGSYARDIRVCIYDGKMHPVDSNEISFKLAGRNAFREAFKNAGPKILEPVYNVEVLVPSDRMGDVMSDLQGRRGVVMGMSSEKGFEKIKAKVPLAEMGKYSTALSSLTGGRATYTMEFGEYTAVPGDIQEKLLKEYEEQEDED